MVAAGAVLAATALTGSAAAAPEGAGPRWRECADLEPVGGVTPECATLRVPLDHGSRADPRAVEIALSRVPARGEAEGTLVVNPGGPGSPGRAWAAHTAAGLPEDLRERYDIVGFDPRGTGASTPAVSCDPDHFTPPRPDPVPDGPGDARPLLRDAADYARACAEANGPVLRHMTTVDNAHDMEAIRRALNVPRIDYLGYSYGSLLGGVYATLYPERVRRLVLDSVVDPGRPWYRGNLEQSRALDAAAGNFFAWVARHEEVYGLGSTEREVANHYYRLRERLAADPAKGTVGPAELDSTFVMASYAAFTWPRLARALADHVTEDDPAALLRAHERYGESPREDQRYAVYLATQCTDGPWPRDWRRWRADTAAVHADAPFHAWSNTWYNMPCASWPAPARDWFRVDGSRAGEALLIQASEDGPTPVEGAYAMRERFPNARLVLEEGGLSHGVSLAGNACVDDALARYLRDGTLPPDRTGSGPDLRCAAGPEPDPRAQQSAPRPPLPRPAP